jgi:hypothetical protein
MCRPRIVGATVYATCVNVFMEITRRDDMGSDLKAPSLAHAGVPTSGYELVSSVGSGDVVIHYDSRQKAIVGVSLTSGSAESTPILWVARQSYALRAGERPRWLPGIRVPLSNYRQLTAPLTLAQIRAKKDEILAIRTCIQAHANGRSTYFPWIPYRDTLRTFQSYLVKVPHEVIALFPSLHEAVEHAAGPSSILDAGSMKRSAGVFGLSPTQLVLCIVVAAVLNGIPFAELRMSPDEQLVCNGEYASIPLSIMIIAAVIRYFDQNKP